MEFSKNQLKAINHYTGNCCVLASAGSGKTSVLTNRIVNLIQIHNVKPENILAITFSVKARENMQNKLSLLIGDMTDNVTIETFHALGNKLLKESKYNYFYNKIQQWQQKQMINNIVIKSLKIEDSEKDIKTNDILSFISHQKNNLIDCNDKIKSIIHMPYSIYMMQEIYQKYESTKRNEKLMDFDDMLINTYKLLSTKNIEREKYQDRYQFILVDEFQDTNKAQYEILRLLGKKHNNVFVVGDPLQCLLPDTLISTPDGHKKIKDIKQNDKIIVAYGRGKKVETEVSTVLNKQYVGKIIKITTKTGKILEGTPNHCIFTKQLPKDDMYYVYLMYKNNYGYRIGITSSSRAGDRNKVNGYEGRLTQEQADELWIIETCNTMEEAMYYEAYYSYKYGIPQNVFLTHSKKGLNQESLDKLFDNINTSQNVKQLMEDKLLFKDIPYHTQAGGINKRRINFTMFDHTTPGKCNYLNDRTKNNRKYIHRHGVTIDTSNKEFIEKVKEYLKPVHKRNTKGYDYLRFTKHNFDYDYLFELVHIIKTKCEEDGINDVKINFNAKITDILYKFTPMSYARKGMSIPIENEDGIIDDEIESVEIYDYEGLVYDINVDYYRNYIANGIVVHNCIYEWNLANNDYLINFHKDWIDATVIPLNINYRSTQDIVEISNKLVKGIKETTHENYYESIANKSKYRSPEFSCFIDEFYEANGIAKKILEIKPGCNFSDFAILTRTNFQIQAIERGLYQNKIPYEVIGGRMFYELKEIQDMISYLRLINNTSNDNAFKQIYNSPNRYLGSVFLNEVSAYSQRYKKCLFDSMLHFPRSDEWRYKKGINELYNIVHKLRKRKRYKVGDLIDIIRVDLDYDKYILKEDYENNLRSEKIDNLEALVTFANKYNNIVDFLEEVDNLLGFAKNSDVPDKVKVMTIHKSKGLEFPVVFVAGVTDSLLPHAKSDNQNEECRLFYVASTRAEKELFISSTMFYNDKDMEISQFVYDIFDEEYIKSKLTDY